MKIYEAAENYLETILILTQRDGRVRSIDVANHLNYSKPTISVVMKQFRENGYIRMDDGGYITLTEKGAKIAGSTYERHRVIAEVLTQLGVDEKTAYDDACKIEHAISEKTFECIKDYHQREKQKAQKGSLGAN